MGNMDSADGVTSDYDSESTNTDSGSGSDSDSPETVVGVGPESDLSVEEIREVEEAGLENTVIVADVQVSASEKVSTGEYEIFEPYASMEGSVIVPKPWPEASEEIEEQLLSMHQSLQTVIQRACDNRLAAPGHETWPDSGDE